MSDTRGGRLAIAMAARCIPKISVLALAVGVSESAVSRWRADGPMTLDNVIAVCRYLNISVDWFLFGDGPMERGVSSPTAASPWGTVIQSLHPAAQKHLLLFLAQLARAD